MKFSLHGIKSYIISFVFAFVLTLLLLSILSIIFTFFPPSEMISNFAYDYITTVSAFIAALFCAYRTGKHGLLTGIFSAVFYTATILLPGSMLFGELLPAGIFLRQLAFSAGFGAIGGIIGINLK